MGLANHQGNAHLFEIQSRQDASRQVLSNGHNGAIIIPNAQSPEHIRVLGICHHRLGHKVGNLLDIFRVLIQGKHLVPQLTQAAGNALSEPAQANHNIGFHSMTLLSNQQFCLGIAEALHRPIPHEEAQADGEDSHPAKIHKRDDNQLRGKMQQRRHIGCKAYRG